MADTKLAHALIASAEFIAGRFGLIDDDLRGRIERHVAAIAPDVEDPEHIREAGQAQIRAVIARRIELLADRTQYSGIAEEAIERPIFVIGAGRSGTSLLHNLLAEDPRARAPKWWHTNAPSPPPGSAPVTAARLDLAGQSLDELLRLVPGLLRVHPYWDRREHTLIEDEEIFALDFQNAYPTHFFHCRKVLAGVGANDPSAAYAFHHQFLQHLQWRQPCRHWVCKGVYHQWSLGPLLDRYPDARCILPHRDPAQVYPSVLAIIAVLYGAISRWTIDFKVLGRAILERTAKQIRETLANPLLDDPRVLHVDFRDLVADPVALVQRTYETWGEHCSDEHVAAMRAWLADPSNQPDRYGRYAYNLAPFGVDEAAIDTLFAPYRERFNLA